MKENSTDYMTLPRLSIALVALMALGVSCTHRETGDDLLQPYELRYKASFRSAAPTWQKNDQMGVFSLSHGVVSDDNILYTSSAGDGVFFSTSPIHRSPSSPLEIIAYYPYTTEASQGQIPMNYASQAQGKAPDYFYGKLSDVTWTPEPKVTLSRINALLQLVVTASPDFGDLSHLTVEAADVPLSACFDLVSDQFQYRGAKGTLDLAVRGHRAQAVAAAVVVPGVNYGDLVVTLSYGGRSVRWRPSPFVGKAGEMATYHLTLSGSGSGLHILETKGPGELSQEAPEGPIVLTPDGLKGERYNPYDPKFGAKPIDPSAGVDPLRPSPVEPSVKGSEGGGVPIDPSAGIDPLAPADMDPSIKEGDKPSSGVPIDPSAGKILPLNPGGDFTVKDQDGVPIDPSTPGIDPTDPDEPTPGVDPNDPLGNVRPGVVAQYREEAVVRNARLLDHALFVRHMASDAWFADGGSGTRRNYSILFDTKYHSPRYVAFPMYPAVIGNTKRSNNSWDYDPNLSKSIQPNLSKSYIGGWSRGHMLSSGSRTASRPLNETTFYFSNMVPQNQSQNAGQWQQLEGKERNWAQQVSTYDTLYVVCGPVYSKEPLQMTTDRDGKQIPVPDATYKVFLRQEKSTRNWYSIGFVMPNRALPGTKYSDYSVTVSEVERQTGLQFFTHLPKDKAVGVKSQNDQSHWR